jgi:hypothetical protein
MIKKVKQHRGPAAQAVLEITDVVQMGATD